jgi:hypothetical protein
MDHETYIQEHCQCGIDRDGKWSEKVFDEHGCTCRDRLPDFGYAWINNELIEIEV